MRRGKRATWAFEFLAIGLMVFAAAVTVYIAKPWVPSTGVLSPGLVVLLLILNLAPAIVLLMLIGQRIAFARAAQSSMGTTGQLHVRLVAIFSMLATVPMLAMLIIASLLFQYGVDIWYSTRARQMFENTTVLSQQLYGEKQNRVIAQTNTMAGDLAQILGEIPIDSPDFANEFGYQVYQRELSEAAIISITAKNGVQSLAMVNPYKRPTENWVAAPVAKQLLDKRQTVFGDTGKRMEAVSPIPGSKTLFLYASRVSDDETLNTAQRAAAVLKDYKALIKQSQRLQLGLNAGLYLVSLLIIMIAVFIALRVADRLVTPVSELVGAARRIASGDLAVRVTPTKARDEVGTLTRAFNRMTERLAEQNTALLESNELAVRRRALIETVLGSVTAGVIALSQESEIRLMNAPASVLLGVDADSAVGQNLVELAPDLAKMIFNKEREGVVQLVLSGEARTLAVKTVEDDLGFVLTFDDITEQLMDQRRAAWSDVARRVAHEIKNPLTPIQLAAERLKRKFAKEITSDEAAFVRLTDTIVRQVGDLRRMVDEFSSFARMPKPVFAGESIIDIVREAVFLHEVANPSIKFVFESPTHFPMLVCDRRQLAQAISNVVKNGVEAIRQKPEEQRETIKVSARITSSGQMEIEVVDSGIGLPVERDRIIEPYMTTRPGGTGLGLAIVKKIIEEHAGTIRFADANGGGTSVTLSFDAVALGKRANLEKPDGDETDVIEPVPAGLTRSKRGD